MLGGIVKKSWKTATGIRNYVLNNVLIDKLTSSLTYKPVVNSEVNILANMGNQFEDIVYSLIKEKIPYVYIKNRIGDERAKSEAETVDAMKNGIPIILQGCLISPSEKLKGTPDIIIRSDYIASIITNPPVITNNPCVFSKDYHYRIIDIKFMTLKLSVDKNYLLQTSKTTLYKTQLFTYNLLLSEVQNFNAGVAYILGRRWTTAREHGKDCFDRLAPINFRDADSNIAQLAIDAYKHYDNKNVKEESLYPNMKLPDYFDNGFTQEKQEIAIKNAEITQIYYCGTQQRDTAINNGFNRWDDLKCNALSLGFRAGTQLSTIVDNFITVNKSSTFQILPANINMPPKKPIEFFIDFETAGDLVLEDFSEMPVAINSTRIYLIGVVKVEAGIVNYKSFVVKNLSLEEEKRNIDKFMSYIYKTDGPDGPCPLYHWGHIESSELVSALKRHPTARWNVGKLNLIDICKVLRDNSMAVKGSFTLKLKDIAFAFYEQGLIKSKWESETKTGKASILSIKKIAKEAKDMGVSLEVHPEFKDLINYNRTDCTITYEIIEALRS